MKQVLAATSNMLARIRELEITANNISNVNTPGYKRDQYFANILEDAQQATGANQTATDKAGLKMVERNIVDLSQGSLHKTGNPLDLGINGKGFFVIQDEDAGDLYTRNGSFQVNDEGYLTTSSGKRVLGDGGEIYLENGEVRISKEGNISVNGDLIDKLRLVLPEEGTDIIKLGNSEYQFEAQPVNSEEDHGVLVQGFLEQSNVNPISAIVKLVALQRDFDSNQKMVQSFDDINKVSANDVGRI
ncbi:MAG: flagellar hook-basal body protein [Candidatus Marinimicrobia bacterium]|nr:flagellar hook-basal body protein [Candidatus Neomarinimicrobiota bacterium]MCF7880530.1 flagellar hook-basal body protein [Candidatus Neomarinimicrobiota bacterium]